MNRREGDTARGPKNLQATGVWRAIEAEFLATGESSSVQNALTLARDEAVVEAYRAAIGFRSASGAPRA